MSKAVDNVHVFYLIHKDILSINHVSLLSFFCVISKCVMGYNISQWMSALQFLESQTLLRFVVWWGGYKYGRLLSYWELFDLNVTLSGTSIFQALCMSGRTELNTFENIIAWNSINWFSRKIIFSMFLSREMRIFKAVKQSVYAFSVLRLNLGWWLKPAFKNWQPLFSLLKKRNIIS